MRRRTGGREDKNGKMISLDSARPDNEWPLLCDDVMKVGMRSGGSKEVLLTERAARARADC